MYEKMSKKHPDMSKCQELTRGGAEKTWILTNSKFIIKSIRRKTVQQQVQLFGVSIG